MSRIVTRAPIPAAILAALVPTTPPPRMTMLAGATPGTPLRRMPRPSMGRSRYLAPSWIAIRPAISLMGVSSGSEPSSSWSVSYARQTAPRSSIARVRPSSAAK